MSKHKCFFDSNNIISVQRIIISQMGEHIHLNIRLIIKLLLVPNDLQSNKLLGLVIKHSQSLAKGSLPNRANYLISVPNMILEDHKVISSLVIIPKIMLMPYSSIYFLCLMPNKPDFLEIKYFALLVVGKYGLESSNSGSRFERIQN